MQIELNNQVIVVTGGSEGLGAEISRHAAKCGAKVAILSRDEEDMQKIVEQIQSAGGQAAWFKADVTIPEEVSRAIDETAETFGQIDGLVANAGTNGTWAPVDELTVDQWKSTIDVNLTGTFLAAHYCVPHLRKQSRGSIVIMSSINGTRTFSNEGASAYAASKAGQFALAQMLALELAPAKIRVNAICPGAFHSGIHEKTNRENLEKIETPIIYPEGAIPLLEKDEMGDPAQVAALTVFLLSDLARHITGTPVWIDGGQSLII